MRKGLSSESVLQTAAKQCSSAVCFHRLLKQAVLVIHGVFSKSVDLLNVWNSSERQIVRYPPLHVFRLTFHGMEEDGIEGGGWND